MVKLHELNGWLSERVACMHELMNERIQRMHA